MNVNFGLSNANTEFLWNPALEALVNKIKEKKLNERDSDIVPLARTALDVLGSSSQKSWQINCLMKAVKSLVHRMNMCRSDYRNEHINVIRVANQYLGNLQTEKCETQRIEALDNLQHHENTKCQQLEDSLASEMAMAIEKFDNSWDMTGKPSDGNFLTEYLDELEKVRTSQELKQKKHWEKINEFKDQVQRRLSRPSGAPVIKFIYSEADAAFTQSSSQPITAPPKTSDSPDILVNKYYTITLKNPYNIPMTTYQKTAFLKAASWDRPSPEVIKLRDYWANKGVTFTKIEQL